MTIEIHEISDDEMASLTFEFNLSEGASVFVHVVSYEDGHHIWAIGTILEMHVEGYDGQQGAAVLLQTPHKVREAIGKTAEEMPDFIGAAHKDIAPFNGEGWIYMFTESDGDFAILGEVSDEETEALRDSVAEAGRKMFKGTGYDVTH